METLNNAKTLPGIFYGMHMSHGVAEYRPEGKEMFRVLITDDTIKKMNPTYARKPLFVRHNPEYLVEELENTADGYVIESFYNLADGKHWAKFIVITDQGHEAVKKKWGLSNSHRASSFGPGGEWNGVEYDKEVKDSVFDHLAIVPNPRYETMILTEEQFKEYNQKKMEELKQFQNSKEQTKQETKPMFSFFNKTKVEDSKGIETMSVVLPKSKKEISITQLINEADAAQGPDVMCNMDHHVVVNEKKMKVSELINAYTAMDKELMEMKNAGGAGEEAEVESMDNVDDEEAKKKALELAAHEEEEIKKKKAEDEKLQNEKEAKKKKGQENFEKLANAKEPLARQVTVETSYDQVARGKTRYGSN